MSIEDSIRASQAAEADETPITRTLEDPELAELDFEGQAEREAAAAPETPEPAPAETPEPEPEPVLSVADMWRSITEADPEGLQEELEDEGWDESEAAAQAELLEQLQELAEDDPVAAADVLARLYAEQVHAQLADEVREEFAPIQAAHARTSAVGTIEQLTAELGPEIVQANAPAVAAMLEADEAHYMDPATQQARVRDAFFAAEYARLAGLERGDDVKQAMDEAGELVGKRDAFGYGARRGAAAPAGARPGQLVPAGPGVPPGSRIAGRTTHPVHVEGGSTPSPPMRPRNVDPVIAEMDALESDRDMFGRRFVGR